MKNITVDIMGIPNDIPGLLQEVKQFEKKLHYFYNEATVIITFEMSPPKKTKQNKSGQKKEKKEVFLQ